MFPHVELRTETGLSIPARYRVQKALPGRILRMGGDPLNWEVYLVRSPIEISLILGSSVAFLLLTIVVTIKLFSPDTVLSGVQEVIAVAGFMVATAGFRELVGVSRAGTTSILEVVVFGVPLIALVGDIALSTLRKTRGGP